MTYVNKNGGRTCQIMTELAPRRGVAKGKNAKSRVAAVAMVNTNMEAAKAAAKMENTIAITENTRNERAAAKNTAKSSRICLLFRKW